MKSVPTTARSIGYGFVKTLPDTPVGDAVEKVTACLAHEGFGVLTTIDVAATFRRKLDVAIRPYVILGACNPELAHRALTSDQHMGLLLPCNVVVQQTWDGRGSEVSIVDPVAMFAVVDNPELAPIADQVRAKLVAVLDSIG